jgi:5-methyltetrahydropteroyltriglutamate--homocysteine methyltransferase
VESGRLPPPKGWEDMPARLANAELTDPAAIAAEVTPAIAETVKKQVEAGIDCIGDGEFWTARSLAHLHRAFYRHRPALGGSGRAADHPALDPRARRIPRFLCRLRQGRDLVPGPRREADAAGHGAGRRPRSGQIEGARSHQPPARHLQGGDCVLGCGGRGSVRPGLGARLARPFIFNEYYRTEDEFLFALADALREEYRAVVAAGFILQIDDPGLPDWWDMLKPEPSVEAYRQFARRCIDAVNHALAGIPEESVRYHSCWGSWHGTHTHDLPLEHIIDLVLEVKAQTYSFEAANVRHEHEWRVRQNAKLPPGKMLMPGVVSHATNLVEHPQLAADRILRYAAIVGRENVIAGTDCGLGGRVHADLAWAKLRTLADAARLASKSLWP